MLPPELPSKKEYTYLPEPYSITVCMLSPGANAMSLGEALIALDKDEVVKSALPGDMYRVFEHYKRDEWERFMATVTDWDVEEYLDILP
jgi:glutamine synthetase